MKKLLLMLGMVVSVSAFSAKDSGVLLVDKSDKIVNALNDGNANALSGYFDNFLDIRLPNKEEIKNVGKTQATITIKNFFDENKVQGFEKTSEREMSGTTYLTGKLKCAGKDYNVTLFMKDRGDKLAIISIRIG